MFEILMSSRYAGLAARTTNQIMSILMSPSICLDVKILMVGFLSLLEYAVYWWYAEIFAT
jgi:hypothetical protein